MRWSSSRGTSTAGSRGGSPSPSPPAPAACVKPCSSRAVGSSAINRPSSAGPFASGLLLVRDDVVDRLADGRELAGVVVGDLQPELILEIHDDLHEVERIGAEVFFKGSVLRDLALLDAELLAQLALDLLG